MFFCVSGVSVGGELGFKILLIDCSLRYLFCVCVVYAVWGFVFVPAGLALCVVVSELGLGN